MLFSATMPKTVEDLSRAFLNDPIRIEVSPPGTAVKKVKQSVRFILSGAKTEFLKDALLENPDALSLVFARTKHGAEKLMKHLVASGFKAVSIHGNKSQGHRDRALKEFKTGKANILVATDRIGRTARAGREGRAIAFCAPDERKLLWQIEKVMGIEIPVEEGDGSEDHAPVDPPKRGQRNKAGNRRGDGSSKKKPNNRTGKPSPKKHPRRGKDTKEGPPPAEGRPAAVLEASQRDNARKDFKRSGSQREDGAAKTGARRNARRNKAAGGESNQPVGQSKGKPHHAKGARSGKPRSAKFGGPRSGGRSGGGKPSGGKGRG
jgi:ATP-dependent RNA helicase RhlE